MRSIHVSMCVLILTRCLANSFITPSEIEKAAEGRIVGGHQATPHSHPYIVSLQLRFLWIRAHICGGSILNERWVITAAHCVTNSFLIRWLNMDAVAGAHDVNHYGPKAQVVKIIKRIPHPDYTGGVAPKDVAVLQTDEKFIFTKEVKPISLPIDTDLKRGNLILPGWGALKTTVFIPDLPSKLQELRVTYVPYDKCNKKIDQLLEDGERNPLDKESNICTGPLGGGTAACNGDSGGPLVLRLNKKADNTIGDSTNEGNTKIGRDNTEFENTDAFLVGIVSWGVSPCGEKGAPTVFTNVSRYENFINSHINT